MENTYSNRLVSWCNKICNIFDWNLEKEIDDWNQNGSRRVKPDENLKKTIYKAKNESGSYYGRNIVALYDNIFANNGWSSGFIDALSFSTVDDFKEEIVQEKVYYIELIRELIELYNDWEKYEFQSILKSVSKAANFKNSDFKLHPSILEEINKIIINKNFDLYKFRDSGEKIESTDVFYFSSQIGFSDDLTQWLDHVRNQSEFLSERPSNEVYITLFGKIDDVHPIYSNWIFTLHKKDTIWILTDQIGFDNPYQKTARLSRKGTYRERYEHQDDCDLPFYLFEDIDSLRAKYGRGITKVNNKIIPVNPSDSMSFYQNYNLVKEWFENEIAGIVDNDIVYCENRCPHSSISDYRKAYAKRSGRIVAYWEKGMENIIVPPIPEIFIMPTDDLRDGEKAFILLLLNEVLQFHSSEGIEHKSIQLARDYVEVKRIENAQIHPLKTTSLTYWNDDFEKIFREVYDTINDIDGEKLISAVAPINYQLISENKKYNENWLSTPEKLHSLSEWLLVDAEKQKIDKKIKLLKDTENESAIQLHNLFNERFDIIISKIQLARNIEFKSKKFSFGFSEKRNTEYTRAGSVGPAEASGVEAYRGYGIGKRHDDKGRFNYWYEDYCHCCGKNKARVVHLVRFTNYKEIMWLLDIQDRKEIPVYYRNYRSHSFIPYKGNSLLDQTHPFNRIKDPFSDQKPNGFDMRIFMCKRCYNKLEFKQEEATVIIEI